MKERVYIDVVLVIDNFGSNEMDRRSWLWRRKSSETESSDDQYPELTSKASEETCDDKLSAALLTINAKDELVKQHAKVAEEAVSGWENAEKELVALKHQLEDAAKKNSELEDRVGHLDAALKECMRQLRQAKEDQEQKVDEALARKTTEWESIKSDLETKLIELQAELQTAKSESAKTNDSDIQHKLEAVEKKNAALKLELLSQAEELEIRFMERELSIQAAETASKLHLESIKKVAKLEAECRRLKSIARRASPHNDNKSLTASSFYVESFTDSLSDSGERMLSAESDTRKIGALEISECEATCASALIAELDQFKNQRTLGRRNIMVSSAEIDLMDDFLEMERLAALPDTESGSSYVEAGTLSYQVNGGEMSWKADLETMIHRTAELEERLENIEEEKAEAQNALTECHKQLEMSQVQLKQAEVKLIELQAQLALANEAMEVKVEEIEGIKTMREKAETQLLISENEIKTLLSKVDLLGEEIFKERALSAENLTKCHELENELLKQKHEAYVLHDFKLKHDARYDEEVKAKQEKELAVAASKFAECQKTIASLGRQLKSLATMEDFPEFPINVS